MKKTGLLIITILLTLAGVGDTFASDTIFTEGMLQYRIEEADDGGKQISITKYYGDDENFQVPWSIGLLAVKHIEDGAFADSPVVRVMLPDNEVECDPDAFRDEQRVSGYRIGEEYHFEDDDDPEDELTDGGGPEIIIDPLNPEIIIDPLNPVVGEDELVSPGVENGTGNTPDEQRASGSSAEQRGSDNSGSGSGSESLSSARTSSARTSSENGTVDAEPLEMADARDDTSASEAAHQSKGSEFAEFEVDIPEDDWDDSNNVEEVKRIKNREKSLSGSDEKASPEAEDTDAINGTLEKGSSIDDQPEKKTGLPIGLIAALAVAIAGAAFVIIRRKKGDTRDGSV